MTDYIKSICTFTYERSQEDIYNDIIECLERDYDSYQRWIAKEKKKQNQQKTANNKQSDKQ